MPILTSYDRSILEKFENGGSIKTKDEWEALKEWAAVGFVSFGFLSGEAKLTEEGKFALHR